MKKPKKAAKVAQESEAMQLTRQDIEKWLNNLLLFSTPALLIFLTALAQGTPLSDAINILYVAILNALIDLLRKYFADNQK